MDTPDEALITAALAGDLTAFDRLVNRYYAVSLRFAWRQLGNRADAEEVVQDSWLRAYRALRRCHDPARFRGWLLRIVVNQCRSWSARQQRRAWLLQRWWRPEPAVEAQTAEAEDTAALLQPLSPALREAFLLKHVEELSYEEMSAITGASVSALKMRVKRATDLLAERLQAEQHA